MPTLPLVHNLSITDPPENANLGQQFSVCGKCDGQTPDKSAPVTVTFSGKNLTIVKEAVINYDEGTWEAYFENVPCGTGSLSAACEGGTSSPVDGLTVVTTGTGGDTTVAVTTPADGQAFAADLSGAVAAGTRWSYHAVAAQATLGGTALTAFQPVDTDLEGLGSAKKHTWSIALVAPVPNPVAGTMYGLHIQVTDTATDPPTVYEQAAGYFWAGTAQLAQQPSRG